MNVEIGPVQHYDGRRRIWATYGPPADGHRLLLAEVRGHAGSWNVLVPGSSYVLRGEIRGAEDVLLLAAVSLREAKAYARTWLGTPLLDAIIGAEREHLA